MIIVSFQVDHFPLLERALSSLGYEGHFVAKPDSPCIYLPSNSGPDGCALFYKKDQWELMGEVHAKTLEVFKLLMLAWQYVSCFISKLFWCTIYKKCFLKTRSWSVCDHMFISPLRYGMCKATRWL